MTRRAADAGRSADLARGWARRYNQPSILSELKFTAVKSQPQPARLDSVLTARAAVERSVLLLRTASARVMTDGGCVRCHAQPISARRPPRSRCAAAGKCTRTRMSSRSQRDGRSQLERGWIAPEPGNRWSSRHPAYNVFMAAEMKLPATLGTEAFVSYLAAKAT